MFPVPDYTSTTKWRDYGLEVPNSAASADAQIEKMCHCLFEKDHVFQWVKGRSSFKTMFPGMGLTGLIAHSSPTLEKAMWMLQDLFIHLRTIVEGEGSYILGQVIQQALFVLRDIKAIDWGVLENRKGEMYINCNKTWANVTTGQYKVPWYLVSNESLVLWLQAELVLNRQRYHQAKQTITKADYTHYAVKMAKLLAQSLQESEFCDSEYITGLKKRHKTIQIRAFVVLGTATSDDREKYALFHRAITLVDKTDILVDIDSSQLEGLRKDYENLRREFVGLGTIGTFPDADSLFAKHVDTIDIDALMKFKFCV
jgi:hypothetical protein